MNLNLLVTSYKYHKSFQTLLVLSQISRSMNNSCIKTVKNVDFFLTNINWQQTGKGPPFTIAIPERGFSPISFS